MQTQTAVHFEQVTYQYPRSARPALRGATVSIPQGGVFGLLGPNGAGKTTFLRLLTALLPPITGRVRVLNLDTTRAPLQVRRQIGYVPQEYALYPQLTGWEFLHYMALLAGLDEPAARADELLAWAGLRQAARRKIRTYSGGMKQRLAVAQALLGQPPLLVLDEPTTGLDPEERLRFKDWILEYAQEHTVVFSSHLVEDVALLCDRVAVLREGEVRYQGPVSGLIRLAEGKVWRVVLPRTARQIGGKGVLPVRTRVLEDGSGRMEVRFLWLGAGAPPIADAQPAAPRLEDAYVYVQRGAEVLEGRP